MKLITQTTMIEVVIYQFITFTLFSSYVKVVLILSVKQKKICYFVLYFKSTAVEDS